MAPEAISAPSESVRHGLLCVRGYCEEERGGRIFLAFEPLFTESDKPRDVPCLRLDFRIGGERFVPERFVVCGGTEERVLDLDAAHGALL